MLQFYEFFYFPKKVNIFIITSFFFSSYMQFPSDKRFSDLRLTGLLKDALVELDYASEMFFEKGEP